MVLSCQVIVAGLNFVFEILWFPSATSGCISILIFVPSVKTLTTLLWKLTNSLSLLTDAFFVGL